MITIEPFLSRSAKNRICSKQILKCYFELTLAILAWPRSFNPLQVVWRCGKQAWIDHHLWIFALVTSTKTKICVPFYTLGGDCIRAWILLVVKRSVRFVQIVWHRRRRSSRHAKKHHYCGTRLLKSILFFLHFFNCVTNLVLTEFNQISLDSLKSSI